MANINSEQTNTLFDITVLSLGEPNPDLLLKNLKERLALADAVAIESAPRIIELFKSNNLPLHAADALLSLCREYAALGETATTLQYILPTLDLLASATSLLHFKALYFASYCYYGTGDFVKAVEYCTRCEEMGENLPKDRDAIHYIIGAHIHRGRINHGLGDYSKSMESQLKAAEVSEEFGDLRLLSDIYSNIGMLCHNFGDYDTAISWFNKAMDYSEADNDNAMLYINIGNTYFKKGNLDEAHNAYQKALRFSREKSFKYQEAVALHSIARTYEERDANKAIDHYEQSVELCKELKTPEKECVSLICLGKVLTQTGEYKKALDYLQNALTIAGDLKTPKLLYETHFALAAFFKIQNQWKKAYVHLELYQAFEKQIYNDQSELTTKTLVARFEVEKAKKQAEIFRLKNETLAQEAEFKNRELSSMSLNLLKNNQTLTAIEKQASQALKSATGESGEQIQQIIRYVRSNKADDTQWQQLNEGFRQVHGDFIEQLAGSCPTLTPMELKVSALLKIRFSTKEIADVLCISKKAVEFHRLNIRKKLALPHTTNLTTYFSAQ